MSSLIITVPIYNEGEMVAVNTEKIHAYCYEYLSSLVDWKIVLTENGSTDNTFEVAKKMEQKYPDRVLAYHFENRGKATALKCAWSKLEEEKYKMDFISIIDVDIPFDLGYFSDAFDKILEPNVDLVIGNRYSSRSSTHRPLDQIIISRSYNFMCRRLFGIKIHDIQCGLKIFRYEKMRQYIPDCDHPRSFFDLQIVKMLTDHKHGIKEIPIDWDESNNRPTKFIKRREIVDGLKTVYKLLFKDDKTDKSLK